MIEMHLLYKCFLKPGLLNQIFAWSFKPLVALLLGHVDAVGNIVDNVGHHNLKKK